ncbi:MAG: MDR/SDR family oxidoreductase, partial [Acidimicrobiales bacterium]
VLIALGEYPDVATLGGEGAGVVLATGSAVADLVPGDRVFGLLDNGFAATATAPREYLARVPDRWGFADAATTPIVFLTAWYGLVRLAGLKKGDRLLITSAAGGVGLAAIQLARHLGAEVYATAGVAKWPVLRELGLDDAHLADSRTTAFAATFRTATGGHGMDVVLQSAKGEFVDAGLGLLADGGRLLEMGKADLRPAAPGYLPYDLMQAGGPAIQEMLGELLELFAAGVLTPLPRTTWDARQAGAALRHLGQGGHVGKLALTIPRPPDPECVVLITGGTGVLGGLLARHLAERYGVRHLVLAGRRPAGPPAGIDADVRVAACDVADRDQVAALLAGLDRPLTMV